MAAVEMYDVEQGLREVARLRRKTDQFTRAQLDLGDRLASFIAAHFGPEATETAGLAMVIAAASVGVLAAEPELSPVIAVNVIGIAGQRLVADARAADEAARTPDGER